MKKLFKKVLTYILIFIISVICVKPMNVSAYGGFFTTDSFTFSGSWSDSNSVSHTAYVMEDDTNLPSGFKYYMKIADGVAICCDGGQVIINILNYKLGLTMSASTIASFIGTYIADNQFTGKDPNFYNLYPPVLKGNTMVGIALNSLTGCRMAYSSGDDSVQIPSGLSNDVYNFYINVFQVDNPELPDFINIPSFPKTEYIGPPEIKYDPTYSWVLNNSTEVYFGLCSRISFDDTVLAYQQGGTSNQCGVVNSISDYRFILKSGYESAFNNCCNTFNLTPQNNTISASDFYASTGINVIYNMYDSNNTKITFSQSNSNGATVKKVGWDATGEGTPPFWESANLSNLTDLQFYTDAYRKYSFFSNTESYLTIYRSAQVISQIQNNTYNQNTYSSETTNNYSTSNDNSYTTNVQNINNSSSNNTQIYNETKTTTNENITNNDYSYDYSSQVTQNTTIINNYYGDNGAPDNGGGGDDNGGGGDNDDDDTIWKALLKAIADFLKKIGELIATIITGLVSIMTSVVNAIASITTSFTAVTDFLGSVFGFLPSDLVAVITLGVTLGILISLIKMFGK